MKSLRFPMPWLMVVGATIMLTPMLGASPASATPVDDQRQRVEQITDRLQELERQADILTEDYAVATDELRQLEDDVAAAEGAVAEQRAAVAELQGELGAIAVEAYMGAGTNGLGPIFTNADEFNAELQRAELTRAALDTGTADSDDLDRELSELSEAQDLLKDQRDAAEQKSEEVEDAKAATEDQTAEYQTARIEAEAELGDLIQQEEERRARESYERMQREAEAAAAAAQAEAAAAAAQAQQQAQSAAPAEAGNETASAGNNSADADNSSSADNNSSSADNNSSGAGNSSADADNSSGGDGPAPAVPASEPAATATPVNIPAASSRAGTAISAAMTQQGVPWVFARADPGVAFDCSGLTSWAWAQAGVSMPHQSRAQYASFPHVPSSSAQPGDLIFFYSPISHVGLYMGNGQMIHSPNAGSTVHVRTVNWGNVVGVARPG